MSSSLFSSRNKTACKQCYCKHQKEQRSSIDKKNEAIKREASLQFKDKEAAMRSEELARRADDLARREHQVREQTRKLEKKVDAYMSKEDNYHLRLGALERKEKALKTSTKYTIRQARHQETSLQKLQKSLKDTQTANEEREASLARREAALEGKLSELKDKEALLVRKETRLLEQKWSLEDSIVGRNPTSHGGGSSLQEERLHAEAVRQEEAAHRLAAEKDRLALLQASLLQQEQQLAQYAASLKAQASLVKAVLPASSLLPSPLATPASSIRGPVNTRGEDPSRSPAHGAREGNEDVASVLSILKERRRREEHQTKALAQYVLELTRSDHGTIDPKAAWAATPTQTPNHTIPTNRHHPQHSNHHSQSRSHSHQQHSHLPDPSHRSTPSNASFASHPQGPNSSAFKAFGLGSQIADSLLAVDGVLGSTGPPSAHGPSPGARLVGFPHASNQQSHAPASHPAASHPAATPAAKSSLASLDASSFLTPMPAASFPSFFATPAPPSAGYSNMY